METVVTIEQFFKEEQTHCQECSMCESIIVSSVYRMTFDVGRKIIETDIILCNSCYNAVKDKDA